MFHFKILPLLLVAVFSCSVHAADNHESESTPAPIKTSRKNINYLNVGIGYLSWGEPVRLTNNGQTDSAHTNLLGNSLMVEQEHYVLPRLGFTIAGSYIFGVADAGGGQVLTYQQSNLHWWGFEGSARGAYRFSKWVIVTAGPFFLYRSLTLPVDSSGTTAQSGASFNYGASADLRLRLFEKVEIRQEMGMFISDADTYWSLGAIYKF